MRVRTRPAVRRGAAAAEFAIVLPFLVFLFVIAVDFCRVFYCVQTVTGAAETAALYASGAARHTSDLSAEAAAQQAGAADGTTLDPPLRPGDVAVSLDATAATVTVSYDFKTLTSYPGIPDTIHIVRIVRMPLAPRAPGDTNN
jgi:Flp pilus assembly protein TadG